MEVLLQSAAETGDRAVARQARARRRVETSVMVGGGSMSRKAASRASDVPRAARMRTSTLGDGEGEAAGGAEPPSGGPYCAGAPASYQRLITARSCSVIC